MKGCCGQHRVLELSVSRPRKVHSGKNRSRSPSRGSGSARLAPHQSSASAATRMNTSPGKVLSRGCRGASSLTSSKMSASRASPSSRTRRAVTVSPGGRPLPGRHHDGTAEPPIAGRPYRRMPAAGRCSAAPPPARHVVSLPYELRHAREPPLCALILVDYLVSEDAPNGPIGMSQRLASLKVHGQSRGCGSNGVSGAITPGVMAWRESCRSDRDTGAGAGLAWRQGGTAQSRLRFASAPGSEPRFPRCCAWRLRTSGCRCLAGSRQWRPPPAG